MALTPEERRARNAARMRLALADPVKAQANRDRVAAYAKLHPECARRAKERYDTRRRDDVWTWARHMASSVKSRCTKRSIPFELTAEQIMSLIPPDGLCPALGIPLIFGGRLSRNSPSIDRVVPGLGYVFGNVAIISHKANSMKQDCTDPGDLRRIADWLEAQLGRSVAPRIDESRLAA